MDMLYSGPLNNVGLNCLGPLMQEVCSTNNTVILHSAWVVESKNVGLQIQKADCKDTSGFSGVPPVHHQCCLRVKSIRFLVTNI